MARLTRGSALGTCPVTEDVAGNFHAADPESIRWLGRIFEAEDGLILSGQLQHDFAVVIARRPH